MKNNRLAINQMIRLSNQIRLSKEARCKLNVLNDNTKYIINKGVHAESKVCLNNATLALLKLEVEMKNVVQCLCENLIGFDSNISEPINYISSSDITNKLVELCSNGFIVGYIDIDKMEVVYCKKGREEKPKGE